MCGLQESDGVVFINPGRYIYIYIYNQFCYFPSLPEVCQLPSPPTFKEIFETDTNRYVSLEMKNYVKYLGILIDKNLSWKIHIDNVATKLSKTVSLNA